MSEDLLLVIEQNKELLDADTYSHIKNNLDKIPAEMKAEILVQLQNAVHLKKMVEEYEDQRVAVLTEATENFKKVEEGYKKQYEDSMKQLELEEQESALEKAEDSLSDI